jgi:mitogen-activated protein kinase organizer 1
MLSTAVRTLKAHEGAVHVVRYNSTGGYFLSGGQDRKIILQNPNTGAQIKTYEAHGSLYLYAPLIVGWEVLDIAVSADNAKFASVGGDKAVYVPRRGKALTD